ncbi:MAG: hypothetical protein M3436_02495 [Pseudomonadota bacterium]|nr:hypothetical protein [Pseudomonadota bacterium]
MKWFVFVLLTANILYFSWEYNALLRDAMKRATHDQPIPQHVESLKLLRELDLPRTPRARTGPAVDEDPEHRDDAGRVSNIGQASNTSKPTAPVTALADEQQKAKADSTSKAARSADPAPGQPHVFCFTVGPFVDERAASEATSWLGHLNARNWTRQDEKITAKRYWIFIEPAEPESAARAILEDLKTKGVEDYMLFRDSASKGIISLGLYSTEGSLEIRRSELRKKGFDPSVRPRHKVVKQHWVDSMASENPSIRRQLKEKFGAQWLARDCAELQANLRD